MILRPDQEKFIADLKHAMRSHKSIVARASTGFGKTVCASHIVAGVVRKQRRAIFMVHRRELIHQTSKTFEKCEIPHGSIASGKPYDPYMPIHIASVDTLKNRLNVVNQPDLLIVDEAHHTNANGWANSVRWAQNQGAFVIGLTATPKRLDGRGLGDFFDTMIEGPSTSWLMENGHLSQYTAFAPDTPDLSNAKFSMGDFDAQQMDTLMDDRVLFGSAITNWLKLAKDKRTIAFCTSVKTSQKLVAGFNESGVRAAHLDAKTPARVRAQIINDFADGNIDILSNVNLFSEGFDLSASAGRDVPIEAIILYRPTNSLVLHLQQIGRVLRPKGYPAIILDHVGNCERLGFPDDDFEWSLEAKKKKKNNGESPFPTKRCPACYMVHKGNPHFCKNCGEPFEVKSQELKVVEGDLKQVTAQEIHARKAELRRLRLIEENACETIEDFRKLGNERGYRPGWAYIRYKSKPASKE